MMNADCLRCDRLIRLQWDGAFRRGGFVQPLRLRGTEGRRGKKGKKVRTALIQEGAMTH